MLWRRKLQGKQCLRGVRAEAIACYARVSATHHAMEIAPHTGVSCRAELGSRCRRRARSDHPLDAHAATVNYFAYCQQYAQDTENPTEDRSS